MARSRASGARDQPSLAMWCITSSRTWSSVGEARTGGAERELAGQVEGCRAAACQRGLRQLGVGAPGASEQGRGSGGRMTLAGLAVDGRGTRCAGSRAGSTDVGERGGQRAGVQRPESATVVIGMW